MEPPYTVHHRSTRSHDLSGLMAARPVPVRPPSPVRADLGALGLPNPGGIAVISVDGPGHPDIPGLARGLTAVRCLGRGPEWTNNTVAYEAALSALRIIYGTGWRGPVVPR